MKERNNESKGNFWIKKYDLHRVVISKAAFADVFESKKAQNIKRVFGKFRVEMDLPNIFDNLRSMCHSLTDEDRLKFA